MKSIREELFARQDLSYRAFNGKLVPGKELIGVRIPVLRALAGEICRRAPEEAEAFLRALPHRYLEENHLHAFLLEREKNPESLKAQIEIFLPYIDNWQTCDAFLPKYLKTDRETVPDWIDTWLHAAEPYTVRYAIRLMIARKDYQERDIRKVIKTEKPDALCVYRGAAWYLSMAARENEEAFLQCFPGLKADERLLEETVKKICESRQFKKKEKDAYRRRAFE